MYGNAHRHGNSKDRQNRCHSELRRGQGSGILEEKNAGHRGQYEGGCLAIRCLSFHADGHSYKITSVNKPYSRKDHQFRFFWVLKGGTKVS